MTYGKLGDDGESRGAPDDAVKGNDVGVPEVGHAGDLVAEREKHLILHCVIWAAHAVELKLLRTAGLVGSLEVYFVELPELKHLDCHTTSAPSALIHSSCSPPPYTPHLLEFARRDFPLARKLLPLRTRARERRVSTEHTAYVSRRSIRSIQHAFLVAYIAYNIRCST